MTKRTKFSNRGWPERSNSVKNTSRNSSLFLESGIYPRKGFITTVFIKMAKLSRSGKFVDFFNKLT